MDDIIKQTIKNAIKAERKAIASRVRDIIIFGTSQQSSDPLNPFSSCYIMTIEDMRMFCNSLADSIEGNHD